MSELGFEFECGILFCGQVRDMLENEIFKGRKIRFREGKGLLSRTFAIIGDTEDVRAIHRRLEHFVESIENI